MKHINRLRLLRQGFTDVDDALLGEVGPWLRLAPAMCGIVALAGTALESWLVLWALVPVAAFTAITAKHPFDLIYDLVIRRLLGREEPLPDYQAPRRFSAVLASVGFFLAGLAFLAGVPVVGVLIGEFFAGPILLAATTDICTGCEMYHRLVPDTVRRNAETRASVTLMLKRRSSITAPRDALKQRPQLRRTG